MKPKLFIYYLDGGDPESVTLSWRLFTGYSSGGSDAGDPFVDGMGRFSDFLSFYKKYNESDKKISKKTEIFFLIPGNLVTYAALQVPTKNKQQATKAIPFLLEEFVIGDIDAMQVSIGKYNHDNIIRASICDKNLINKWKILFESNNIFISNILGLPDIISIQKNQSKIVFVEKIILYKSEKICIQTGVESISVISEMIPTGDLEEIIIYASGGDSDHLKLAKKIKLDHPSIKIIEFSNNIFDIYDQDESDFYHDRINLYLSSSDSMRSRYLDISTWTPLIISIFLLVIFQISLNVSSGLYFNKRSEQIIKNSGVYYQRLFPDEKINNVSLQWSEKLKKSNTKDEKKSFHFIFPLIMGEFLKNVDKNKNYSFDLQQFSFNDDSSEIRININVSNISMLDTVKKGLLESGIVMTILSANEDKGFIKATILVSFL